MLGVSEIDRRLEYNIRNQLERLDAQAGYHVYFKPHLYGLRADAIIVRDGFGIFILSFARNDDEIVSSLYNLKKIKDEFFELYIPKLIVRKQIEGNNKLYRKISLGILSVHQTQTQLQQFLNAYIDQSGKHKQIHSTVEYLIKWGKDSEGSVMNDIRGELHYRWDNSQAIFKEVHSLLNNDCFESIPMRLTRKQWKLTESPATELRVAQDEKEEQEKPKPRVNPWQQKVCGVAGSGKTTVLALRAINIAKRLENERKSEGRQDRPIKILIVVFNITLVHYIRNKILSLCDESLWDYFKVVHYHGLKSYVNSGVDIGRFDAVLVDEGQDFMAEGMEAFGNWYVDLKSNYLIEKQGEFLIFADEKQNIYNRALDNEKKTKTNIVGRWNELKESHRLKNNELTSFINQFQQTFFTGKYEPDEVEVIQGALNFDPCDIESQYCTLGPNAYERGIVWCIGDELKRRELLSSEWCILSSKTASVRWLEHYLQERNPSLEWRVAQQNIDRLINSFLKRNDLFAHLGNKNILLDYDGLIKEYMRNGRARGKSQSIENKYDIITTFEEEDEYLCLVRNAIQEMKMYDYYLRKKAPYQLLSEWKKVNQEKHQNEPNYLENCSDQQLFKELMKIKYDNVVKEMNIDTEDFKKFKENTPLRDYKGLNYEKDMLRRSRKLRFDIDNEKIKMSTIHSYKGFEHDNVILIIDKYASSEVIYTGITRAKKNLIIFNMGNEEFHKFYLNFKNSYSIIETCPF